MTKTKGESPALTAAGTSGACGAEERKDAPHASHLAKDDTL
jgi:hypothetical protein